MTEALRFSKTVQEGVVALNEARERKKETEERNVGCENGAEQTHPNVEVDAGIVRDLLLRVDVLGDVHGDPIATHVRD